MRLGKALLLGFFLAISAIATRAEVPFDFRGARLGMNLSAFRQLKLGAPKAKVLCAGDPQLRGQSYPSISAAGKKAGWIECGFYTYLKSIKQWTPSSLRIGPARGTVRFYFYRQGGRGNAHLFLIQAVIPSGAAPALVEGLTERFGPPKAKAITKVRNAFGATFTNLTAGWSNKTGSIYLRQRDKRIDEGTLAYWHEKLKSEAIKALRAASGPKSGGL